MRLLPRARGRLAVAVGVPHAALAVAVGGPHLARSPAPPHEPVVFVHGYGADASVWESMRADFSRAGWSGDELVLWRYDWREDNRVTARRLADEVTRVLAATGADRVDLVTHSMGTLSSRWYLARLDGTAHVDAWVGIAGPNAGSIRGSFCDLPSCHDRRWGSPLLDALNAGDRTPGAVRYATWWSPCDEVLVPDSTALLAGAGNHRTACLGHEQVLADPLVARQVREFISAARAGAASA